VVVLQGKRWGNKKGERRSGRKGKESQGIFVASRWNEGNRCATGYVGERGGDGVELQVVEEEEEGEKQSVALRLLSLLLLLLSRDVRLIKILRVGLVQETTCEPVPLMPFCCPSAAGQIERRSVTHYRQARVLKSVSPFEKADYARAFTRC